MPAHTLSRRAMPDDMQAALARHAGCLPVTRCKPGQRALASSVARHAERGATRDDIRAARAGLVTLATRAVK